MRREDRVTVQGPVKEQQPDGMSRGELEGSHAGAGRSCELRPGVGQSGHSPPFRRPWVVHASCTHICYP